MLLGGSETGKGIKADTFRYLLFLNLAPLTGIAFASNWLINKLNLKALVVKTTRMTTKC